MIKEITMMDEITEIRRLLTKPLKAPGQAKESFLNYLREKYQITDLESPKAKERLAIYREWPAMVSIFEYIGLGA